MAAKKFTRSIWSFGRDDGKVSCSIGRAHSPRRRGHQAVGGNQIGRIVVDAAIVVRRGLGPELLETVYFEEALMKDGITRIVKVPLSFRKVLKEIVFDRPSPLSKALGCLFANCCALSGSNLFSASLASWREDFL